MKFNIRRVGKTLQHNFFGYYNKSNFAKTRNLLLSNRVSMLTGDLDGTEVAEVGYYDLENEDKFHKLGETTTWNWQMGCQLQWLGQKANKVIFNTRANIRAKQENIFADFRATIVDIDSGATRELNLPIYVMAPNGKFALTLNYSRLLVTHRTIGYFATIKESKKESKKTPKLELAPKNDGIYHMDIETGVTKLILSLDDLRNFKPVPSMDKSIHWVTHMEVNPSGTRFLFIHRWTERVKDETCFLHRLFTINADGSDLRLLECTDHHLPQLAKNFDSKNIGVFDYEKSEYQISHPMWKSDAEIIVWSPHNGKIHYHLYNDKTGSVAVIGAGILNENGHMTYSKNGRWILTDTYPDAKTYKRELFLFDTKNDKIVNIGSFFTLKNLGKHNRCDLHPRWSFDNKMICIDSVHEGSRQIYIIEIDLI